MKRIPVKTIFSAAKNLFVVALIIYLVGFLLEITLPGFISNSFNLNWVLGAVLVLGVLAAVAPEEESPFVKTTGDEVEKPNKTDYLMVIGLGIIGGLLMFYKSDLNLVPRILFSIFVAVFITAVSLYLLLVKDEEISEEAEAVENIPPISPVLPQIRRFLAKPVKVPLGVMIIGLILLGLGLIQAKKKPRETPAVTADQQAQPAEEKGPIALFLDQFKADYIPQPSRQELKETPISIFNGSAQVGSASAMAKFLKTKDFTISRVEDADNSNYQNAIVRFRPDKMKVAEYLADTIAGIYPLVERAPTATDSGEIILILGNPNR